MAQWFKFYGGEFLSDPKMGALTVQERSCWITLLCLAGTATIAGIIEFLTVEVLLQKSGINFDPYHPEEWDKCLSVLKKFEDMKMIKANDNGVIEILNWNKRQETALTHAERQARYREKHLKHNESDEEVTGDVTKVTLDKNRIDKNRIDKKESIKKENTQSLQDMMISYKEKFAPSLLNSFWSYWTEKNVKTGKEHWQEQKYFDVAKRLATWKKKDEEYQNKRMYFKNEDETPKRSTARMAVSGSFESISNLLKK